MRKFVNVVFGVVGIVFVIAALGSTDSGCRNVTGISARRARTSLDGYVYDMLSGEDVQVHGRTCMGADTDGDGYVSCTVEFSTDGVRQSRALECGAGWFNTGSCKAAQADILRDNTNRL